VTQVTDSRVDTVEISASDFWTAPSRPPSAHSCIWNRTPCFWRPDVGCSPIPPAFDEDQSSSDPRAVDYFSAYPTVSYPVGVKLV
jgi:hypothetical protein